MPIVILIRCHHQVEDKRCLKLPLKHFNRGYLQEALANMQQVTKTHLYSRGSMKINTPEASRSTLRCLEMLVGMEVLLHLLQVARRVASLILADPQDTAEQQQPILA